MHAPYRLALVIGTLSAIFLACGPASHAATVRCPVVADATVIPNYEDDVDDACIGRAKTINIEGHAGLGLFSFDMAAARGMTLEKAELRLKRDSGSLHTLTVSTISQPWKPTSRADEKLEEGCSSFSWRTWSTNPAHREFWSFPGSHITDVIFGAGHSLYAEVTAELDADGWYRIPVPAEIVESLAAGTQYGLVLYDTAGQRRVPGRVVSVAGGTAGHLAITGQKTAATAVSRTGAGTRPAPTTTAPSPGTRTPSLQIKLQETLPTNAGLKPTRVWAVPETETISPTTGNRLQDGLPGYIKGNRRGAFRYQNEIWISGEQRVQVEAGRNWFCGFHLIAELAGQTRRLEIKADDLAGPQVLPAGKSIRLYRAWYVRGAKGEAQDGWFADPLLPLTGPVQLPDKANGIQDQANQAFFVDLYIPHQAKPGDYKTILHVRDLDDAEYATDVTVQVKVHPFVLPDALTFIPELNAYSSPALHFKDAAPGTPRYLEIEREYHRLAHEHRCNLNVLGYTQTGQIKGNYAPKIEGQGRDVRVADWSAFDEQFGPYLDGSAFADLPRASVPVPTMYLPFHENWPNPVTMMKPEGLASIMKHMHPRYLPKDAPEFIEKHYKGDLPIEQLFPAEYEQGNIAVAGQFRDHFKAKGWTRTDFQIYLNNKYYWREVKPGQSGQASAWWLLDEPNHQYDILALRYYGDLFKRGFAGAEPIRVIYRCDISRVSWIRDLLDQTMDMIAVSRRFNLEHAWLQRKHEQFGWQIWSYSGHMNPPSQSNRTTRTWCLNAWLNGAHGILWWQSLGSDAAWKTENIEALLLPGQRFGIDGPVGTLRVKMWRAGQQDVELLNLLAASPGWDRKTVARALAAAFRDRQLEKHLSIEPATTAFDVSHDAPYTVHEAIRQAVYKALTTERDQPPAGR